jgi:protocatechuate 3,4-dioxygenase beta subunit
MRILIAISLLGVWAGAQEAPTTAPIEIRGVVLEAGTNQPVADAEVTVDSLPGRPIAMSDLPRVAKTATDSRGTFRITLDKFDTYVVRASKEGYTDDGKNPMRHSISNQLEVKLDKDHSSVDARFTLARPGELRGRVVDDDTGKPIPNFRVYPVGLLYSNGAPAQMGGQPAITDSDGKFVITGRRPGNYLVEIGAEVLGKEQFLEHFTEHDLEVVDHDYRQSYWPGGGGLDSVLPVQLLPGGSADVGTVKARKVPYYRILLSIPATDCPAGEKVDISAEERNFIGGGGGFGQGVCGKDYLLRNYQAGSYQLYLMAGDSAEDRMRVILPMEIVDRNLELTVPFGRGSDIEGRIVVAEGSAKPPMSEMKIHMWSTGPIQFGDERPTETPDAEGRFHFPNRPIVRVRVWVTGLGAGFMVREIRYNGSAVVDNIVALNGNAPQHSLQIVVDDKPARITGSVTDGDRPVGSAHMVLIRWPASSEDVFLSAKSVDGDEGGRFQFAGLAPGEYRILAVAPEATDKLDEPHVLERLLGRAERITLTPGGSVNLSLKLTDPSR